MSVFYCLQASVAIKEVLCSVNTAGDLVEIEVVLIFEDVLGHVVFFCIVVKFSQAHRNGE